MLFNGNCSVFHSESGRGVYSLSQREIFFPGVSQDFELNVLYTGSLPFPSSLSG